MKRMLCAFLCLCVILLSGCNSENPNADISEKMIGVWLTYSEIKSFATSQNGFGNEFETAVKNCKSLGINNIFVHVRAFCDAAYNSKFFPKCDYFGDKDALKIMIKLCHENKIKIHAWINPYRVSVKNDASVLPKNSPAASLLKKEQDSVCITENGIYLNPSSDEARKLILSGVREILDNYEVDGIHFDDYFYPEADEKFDKASYEKYEALSENPMSLPDWRRQNVNALINACYCAVKSHSEDTLFGVSPAADIDKCRNQMFADVKSWIGGGYVDYVIPQLYFGFEYPNERFRFDNLLEDWQNTVDGRVKLFCGLPSYKVGTTEKADKSEWNGSDDIIARQICLAREKKTDGYVFFSYSSLFSDNALSRAHLNKIEIEVKKERNLN